MRIISSIKKIATKVYSIVNAKKIAKQKQEEHEMLMREFDIEYKEELEQALKIYRNVKNNKAIARKVGAERAIELKLYRDIARDNSDRVTVADLN